MGILIFLLILIGIAVLISFIWTLSSTLALVPKEHRLFPGWFCWLFLVPFVSLIFNWMILPFGLPISFKRYLKNNSEAITKANHLFVVGLILCIVWTLPVLFMHQTYSHTLVFLFSLITLILFIVYWVKVASFKKQFLKKTV